MSKEIIINIPSNLYLYGQQLKLNGSKKKVKILVGLGMLNSENELSINLPLDFLMVIESLKIIRELFKSHNIFFYITIWIGDKNAEIILKEKNLFTKDIENLWNSTREIYSTKIKKIMKNTGFEENNWDMFYGTILYENGDYRDYCNKLSESTKFLNTSSSYSREQLFVMHYYKNSKGYDFRLSWCKARKEHKNYNERDEKGCDNEYIETFQQNPIPSIYIKNGFKLSDDMGGLGVGVPYSYFYSEIGKRIPLEEKISLEDIKFFLDNLNEKNLKKYNDIYGKEKKEKESLSEAILRKILEVLKD